MALSYRRFLYKANNASLRPHILTTSSNRRFAEDAQGKPYRPYPMEEYRWPGSNEYWSERGYPSQSAQQDVANYKTEEVYLRDMEARLSKYGKKYSHSERVKELWNQYGWQDDDDRPFSVYGSALSMSEHEEEKWGPGKKILPTHYMNSKPHYNNRQPIPPLQYMNGEQIIRVRGRLARFREWPAEVPSIWKSWNPYVTIAAISGVGIMKELYFINGHDYKELFFLWGLWAFIGSVVFDWGAWWWATKTQESYDQNFLPLIKAVEMLDEDLKKLHALPSFKTVFTDLIEYRKFIGEKALQRTIGNQVQSQLNSTVAKLEAKMVEERAAESEMNSKIKREAVAATLAHFEDKKVRTQFTSMVIKDFSAGNAAKLVTGSAGKTAEGNLFKDAYDKNMASVQKSVYDDARKKGTLPWSFRSEDERKKAAMSPQDKQTEFKARVETWAASHNPVPNAALA